MARGAVPTRGEGLPAGAAQLAGRAGAAAIAPIVPVRAVAVIAAVRLLADQRDERRPAQLPREPPGCHLVAPHQRRMDRKAVLLAERQARLQGIQRDVAAARIAGMFGLP